LKGPTVLHVVESFGGGVATALHQYTLATPQLTHHLLKTEREGDFIDSGETASFAKVRDMPTGWYGAIRSIRKTVKELKPDIIHAHSSFAGFYVRLGLRASRKRPIIYTPHGYASERADISSKTAIAFRFVERVLSLNTSKYAACSPREASLSRFGGSLEKVVYVPNVAHLAQTSDRSNVTSGDRQAFRVVATGRLTPARDPDFFREVALIVRKTNPEIEFVWVGGGEKMYESALNEAGVRVTGWLPRNEAIAAFAAADVHVHPAAWDGFPMVLLEANALRIPSFVREIPAFADVSDSVKFSSIETLAEAILDSYQNHNRLNSSLEIWDAFLHENVQEVQSVRLLVAYGVL
jgi:glycosyltransferase involved in cell wall biosynthesis